MAFFSKVRCILRQNGSKHINSDIYASSPSIFQMIRSISTMKVFVGGLSYSTDDTSLRESFNKYGEVVEARIIVDRETGRSRGFGFVTFTNPEDASSAIQALDGQDLHGRRIKVDYANDRTRGPGFGGSGGYGGGGYGGGDSYGSGGGNYGSGYGGNNYGSEGSGGGYGGGNYASGGYGSGNTGNYGSSYRSGNTGNYGSESQSFDVAGGNNYGSEGSGGGYGGGNYTSGGGYGSGNTGTGTANYGSSYGSGNTGNYGSESQSFGVAGGIGSNNSYGNGDVGAGNSYGTGGYDGSTGLEFSGRDQFGSNDSMGNQFGSNENSNTVDAAGGYSQDDPLAQNSRDDDDEPDDYANRRA